MEEGGLFEIAMRDRLGGRLHRCEFSVPLHASTIWKGKAYFFSFLQLLSGLYERGARSAEDSLTAL